jgi:hypothetical protein
LNRVTMPDGKLRICFVENRGMTAFWEAVADGMRARGHEIAWIVQNHGFVPRRAKRAGDQVVVIPYPRPQDMAAPDPELIAWLSGDRGAQHFGNGTAHYNHYNDWIATTLDDVKPDVLIGEPTLFHEQIALRNCRSRGIPYVYPAMCRYPRGRFAVLDGEYEIPLGGSGEAWDAARLGEEIDLIASGKTIPVYMDRPDRLIRLRHLAAGLRIWCARLGGERFNTPSLWRKAVLARALHLRLGEWEVLARPVPEGKKALLYPLQMQPEANINLYGRPFADQTATIRAMLAAAPPQVCIAVKANPKAKYEVTDDLLALAAADARIVLLPLATTMADAQRQTTGSLTVTGTVGLEAVFGKGRCLSLRHAVLSDHLPAFHAASIEEGVTRLLTDPDVGKGVAEDGAWLLSRLIATSWPGTVNETMFDRDALHPDNIQQVIAGIEGSLRAAFAADTQLSTKDQQ